MSRNERGEIVEVKMFSAVRLKDGSEGTVVEIWKSGEDYEFEPDDHSDFDDGAPLTYLIHHDAIAMVIA